MLKSWSETNTHSSKVSESSPLLESYNSKRLLLGQNRPTGGYSNYNQQKITYCKSEYYWDTKWTQQGDVQMYQPNKCPILQGEPTIIQSPSHMFS